MALVERGVPLVERVIAKLKGQAGAARTKGAGTFVGASRSALDALESKLMVELPPTLRLFLAFDFTFASFGPKWKGTARFGADPKSPRPRATSARKLAEAKTDLGWTDSRLRQKLIRLPNLPKRPWNALYLGEARRDGELVILGIDNDETAVRVYPRYTAFDIYLVDQLKLASLTEGQRLEDLESHIALNPELGGGDDDEDADSAY